MSAEPPDDGMPTEERMLLAERDTARAEAGRLRVVIERLVRRYVKDPGGYAQFIAVVNVEASSMPEWDAALEVLGIKSTKRGRPLTYSRGSGR